MNGILLPKLKPRDEAIAKIVRYLHALPIDKAFWVLFEPYRKKRSADQNAYLWVTYQKILEAGGESLGGWTKEDLHEFFLGEHFGWETLEGFGRKRMKPRRRSSKLSTTEFMDFIAFIQRRCAELGIYVADPGEQEAA
jgi:hypothetical protein